MQWLDEKRPMIEFAILASASIIAFALIVLIMPKKGDVVRYDCSISEISPDYPIEVKEQCRKLRADNLLQKPK
jgi:hypothetical protein